MSRLSRVAVLGAIGVFVGVAGRGQDPGIFVPLTFENLAAYANFQYGFGLDGAASDDFMVGDTPDTYDRPGVPPPPFFQSGAVTFVSPDNYGLSKDVRQLQAGVRTYYWRLEVDVVAPDQPITMKWDTDDLTVLDFDGDGGTPVNAELRDAPNGNVLMDMINGRVEKSYVFDDEVQVETIYIVLWEEEPDFPPVARNDGPVALFLGASVDIPVLANDDGHGLTVQAGLTPTHGTATTDGTTVSYTAPGTLAEPAGGWPEVDTFSYTIEDGQARTSNADITVRLYANAFGTRDHAERAKAGVDGGLTVTVTIVYNDQTVANVMRYREVMPRHYELPAGGRDDEPLGWRPRLDEGTQLPVITPLQGDTPTTVTFDENTFEMVLEWPLAAAPRADATLQFKYDIYNPLDPDTNPEVLGDTVFEQGNLEFGVVGAAEEQTFHIPDTEFQAVAQLYHTADFRTGLFDPPPFAGGNWEIDAGEAARVVEYFVAGAYREAPVTPNTPDGFEQGVSPGPLGAAHDADFRAGLFDPPPFSGPNGEVDAGEAARVVEYFKAGVYETAPKDATNPDGYRVPPRR